MRREETVINQQLNENLISLRLDSTSPLNELQQQMFDHTEFITLNLLPAKLDEEIPDDKEQAYKTGYKEALIDAKIYFRTLIVRFLGEKNES